MTVIIPKKVITQQWIFWTCCKKDHNILEQHSFIYKKKKKIVVN